MSEQSSLAFNPDMSEKIAPDVSLDLEKMKSLIAESPFARVPDVLNLLHLIETNATLMTDEAATIRGAVAAIIKSKESGATAEQLVLDLVTAVLDSPIKSLRQQGIKDELIERALGNFGL